MLPLEQVEALEVHPEDAREHLVGGSTDRFKVHRIMMKFIPCVCVCVCVCMCERERERESERERMRESVCVRERA